GPPAAVLRTSSVAPPVVELGRRMGWNPLPLSIRDARRRAGPVRDVISGRSHQARRAPARDPGPAVLRARNVLVRYGDLVAVREVDVDLRRGEVVAMMGRNGSGKLSLLWALQGSGRRQAGVVSVPGPHGTQDPHQVSAADARRLVGLVPQTA